MNFDAKIRLFLVESGVPGTIRPNSDGHNTRGRPGLTSPRPPSTSEMTKNFDQKILFWETSVTYLIDYPNEIEKWKIFGLDAGG